MRNFFMVCTCALVLIATQANADILEQIAQAQGASAQTDQFCKKEESKETCSQRYDALFHKALEKNRPLFGECLQRVGRTFPKDMLNSLIQGKVTLNNNQKLDLYDAQQALAGENITHTAACIMALLHTVSDDLARELGITVSEQNHLARFDNAEKQAKANETHGLPEITPAPIKP